MHGPYYARRREGGFREGAEAKGCRGGDGWRDRSVCEVVTVRCSI